MLLFKGSSSSISLSKVTANRLPIIIAGHFSLPCVLSKYDFVNTYNQMMIIMECYLQRQSPDSGIFCNCSNLLILLLLLFTFVWPSLLLSNEMDVLFIEQRGWMR